MRRWFKGRVLAVEIRGNGDSSWGSIRLDDGYDTSWANCSTEYATDIQGRIKKEPAGVQLEAQTQIAISKGYLRERIIEPRKQDGGAA